jgi:hypothetical protein
MAGTTRKASQDPAPYRGRHEGSFVVRFATLLAIIVALLVLARMFLR